MYTIYCVCCILLVQEKIEIIFHILFTKSKMAAIIYSYMRNCFYGYVYPKTILKIRITMNIYIKIQSIMIYIQMEIQYGRQNLRYVLICVKSQCYIYSGFIFLHFSYNICCWIILFMYVCNFCSRSPKKGLKTNIIIIISWRLISHHFSNGFQTLFI